MENYGHELLEVLRKLSQFLFLFPCNGIFAFNCDGGLVVEAVAWVAYSVATPSILGGRFCWLLVLLGPSWVADLGLGRLGRRVCDRQQEGLL